MLHSPLAIGNVFRRLRKRHLDKPNLTQIGELLGISNTAMGNLESGSSHHWTRERVQTLCEYYGVSLEDFDAMCKAEDEFLDSTTVVDTPPPLSPEEEAKRKKFMQAVTPRGERIEKLIALLSDELPPKTLEAELNSIALKHGLEP